MRTSWSRQRLCLSTLIACSLMAAAGPALAQGDLEDILGGFEDEDETFEVDEEALPELAEERWYSYQGDISQSMSVSLIDHDSPAGTDYSGVQRFRTKLFLQVDADIPEVRGELWKFRVSGYGFYDAAYRMNGRSDYTDDVLDTHEYDFQLMDTYLEGAVHDKVDLKLGRQVVNWGRSETFRVLDIINPLDNREPGLMDIEDIYRPVGMVKLGWFHGPWTLTALVIPEIQYGLLPGQGSDQAPDIAGDAPQTQEEGLAFCSSLEGDANDICFDLLAALAAQGADGTISRHEGRAFGRDTEFALNLTGVFSGWDFSLQAAAYNNDNAHFDVEDQRLEHARLWMVGSGANYTIGSWLVKAEIAYSDGYQFLWTREEKSRIDAMVGVEYYGFNNINVAFEIAETHIFEFEDEMELLIDFAKEDLIQTALRVTWDTWNDQLHFTLLGLVLGEKAQDGSFVRLSADYDVFDAFSVEGGFLLFQEGDQVFFDGAGDNDRFFASAKYSF